MVVITPSAGEWKTIRAAEAIISALPTVHCAILGGPLAGGRTVAPLSSARLSRITLSEPDLLVPFLASAAVVVESAEHDGPLSPVAAATHEAGRPLVALKRCIANELVTDALDVINIDAIRPDEVVSGVARALRGYRVRRRPPLVPPDWTRDADQVLHRLGGPQRVRSGGATVQRLGIGPRNGNGQAWAWAQGVESRYRDVDAEAFAAEFATGALDMRFPTDHTFTIPDWKSRDWQLSWTRLLLQRYSHILIEQGLTVCGRLNGAHFHDDLPLLQRHDIQVALVFRGSEIRDPAAHAARHSFSPFRDPDDVLTKRLQKLVDGYKRHLEGFTGPKFVTTLDLLDDLPDATWLPQVLDIGLWSSAQPVLKRRRPIVMHAPSREQMKGSAQVDAVCDRLHAAGLIDYNRLRGVPYAEMPATIGAADVVLDQFALGSYGVLALQALSANRLVIGHVAHDVRARLGEKLPILEADPDSLEEVLRSVLSEPSSGRELAAEGHKYVERYHDGRVSAERLGRWVRGSAETSV